MNDFKIKRMKNIPFTETEIKEIKDHYSQELDKLQKRANEIRGILGKMEGSKVEIISTPEPVKEKVNIKEKKNLSKKAVKVVPSTTSVAPLASNAAAGVNKKGRKPAVKAIEKKAVKTVEKVAKKPVLKAVKPVVKPIEAKAAKKAVVTKVVTTKESKRALKSAKAEIAKAKIDSKKSESNGKKGRKKSADSKKSQYESFILNLISKQGKLLSSKAIFDAVEKEFKVTAADYSKMKATVTVILSKEKANGQLKDMNQTGTKAKLYGISEWFDDKGKLKDSSKLK